MFNYLIFCEDGAEYGTNDYLEAREIADDCIGTVYENGKVIYGWDWEY